MPSTINSIINVIILSIFLILFSTPVQAANLSIEIGSNSTSVAAGRDFSFGYGMVGIAATFMTDAPWSYVATTETLDNPCQTFKDNETEDCQRKGRFQDGDEWELFAKLGYRLPRISRIYLNTGMGLSKQRVADLYLFCTGIDKSVDGVDISDGGCPQSRLFETWGQVDEDYFLTFLGGMTLEMTRKLLFNVDYHTRKGFISGLMWRF